MKKIIRVYPFTDCDGIIIEFDNNSRQVFLDSLLKELSYKVEIINAISSNIPIVHSAYSGQGLLRITSCDDLSSYMKEDIKALVEVYKFKNIPAFDIIINEIHLIDPKVNIDEITHLQHEDAYKYWLSLGRNKCEVIIERERWKDLTQYTGSKSSEYWLERMEKLNSILKSSMKMKFSNPPSHP